MKHHYTIGFSPCPNDTFIFDAFVNKKIDTGDYSFDVIMEDVETLNQWAAEERLDITKLSFPAFFANADKYILLTAGSALGKGVGPLLVTKNPLIENAEGEMSVSIPGHQTTANLLLAFAFPNLTRKTARLFSDIEQAVLHGDTDLGVLIHENRFTYEKKGLKKVADLGEHWEKQMNIPIPLGGIAIKRNIPDSNKKEINTLIRKSLAHAFSNYPEIPGYVKEHSQALEEEVMKKHIELYVNDFTMDIGEEGRNAVRMLKSVYDNMNKKSSDQSLFIQD